MKWFGRLTIVLILIRESWMALQVSNVSRIFRLSAFMATANGVFPSLVGDKLIQLGIYWIYQFTLIENPPLFRTPKVSLTFQNLIFYPILSTRKVTSYLISSWACENAIEDDCLINVRFPDKVVFSDMAFTLASVISVETAVKKRTWKKIFFFLLKYFHN